MCVDVAGCCWGDGSRFQARNHGGAPSQMLLVLIVASQDITVVVHINNIIGTVSKVAAHQDLTHQLLVTHQNGGFVEQAIEAHVF